MTNPLHNAHVVRYLEQQDNPEALDRELQRSAIAVAEPDYSQLCLQLKINGSMAPSRHCWSLYRLEHGYLVLREHAVVRGIVPAEVASEILAELAAINVPPFIEIDMHGCDGESFELFHRSGLHSAKFRWWSVPPEPWAPLVAFHARVVELFNEYLPEVR